MCHRGIERAFRETAIRGDHDMGLGELSLERQAEWGQVPCYKDNGKPLEEFS